MARFATFLALSALVAVASASIKFNDGDESKVVLASFGDASDTVNVLYKGSGGDISVSSSPLYSVGSISSTDAAGGYTNYTIPLNFDKSVGSTDYTVTIGDESITGSIIVAGFVILKDGDIVSGEDGAGISVGQSGTSTFDVKAVGTNGRSVDISGASIVGKELSGPYMKEIDMKKSSISSEKFVLTIAELRVGTGSFNIEFETDAIELRGESFETILKVTQSTSPTPPCVAIGGSITTKDGFVSVPMFNLAKPPRSSLVSKVTITIGSETADWDKSKSSLGVPDQTVLFRISAGGKASITCDGEDAVIQGGDIEVSGDDTPPALATQLISELPESDSDSVFRAVITVVDSDPSMLTKSQGSAILSRFVKVIGGKDGVITAITKGSAIMNLAALVEEDEAAEAEENLTTSFEECEFQKAEGFDCDKLQLGEVSIQKAVAAQGAIAGGGLATWTIVLIACVGAFALILVIMLGLWAVYRRSAEQSESDYSSSGPLGVPDPSDLLYEQSIVRDIYGRGDFPDGGPSQAVAEERAREAALREEFPRPPSSSGLSRGTGTDDASSTYSV